MPKLNVRKPSKALLKRVRFTAKKKAVKVSCGMSHLMSGKSGNKRRKLRRPSLGPKIWLKKWQRMAQTAL
jgi:ribosomal protein L35